MLSHTQKNALRNVYASSSEFALALAQSRLQSAGRVVSYICNVPMFTTDALNWLSAEEDRIFEARCL